MKRSVGKGTVKGDELTRQQVLGGSNKVRRERNRAYLFGGLLLLCLAGALVAVTVLSVIHTVIPVIAVLDNNGHVIKQQVVQKDAIVAEEAIVQSNLHAFVRDCNTFDPAWRQHLSDLCRLRSTPAVAEQYDREIAPDNPQNPYYQLPSGGKRRAQITGFSKLEDNAYQVMFKSLTERPGAEPLVDYFTALVRFNFTAQPMALGDVWENPLGFVVTAYRRDQELSRK
ncbi:type VI secretion protein [Chromobacterium amazonense]|uniref:Type VI secretion protein n=1 Tax=Chromobacterium amazonense TaxID=1382803 RepID=A0A2S9WZ97_9NEIS|nr:type IV secretion system protein [Chromobacterium amazonense]PRP68795.1 type VI secretion protein [Chromobacterium amazonense]